MTKSLGTNKNIQTINQTVAKWLKLSPKIKDFEDGFKSFNVNFEDYPDYKKKFSDDIRNTTYYTLNSIYEQNPLARPLLLKYVLSKERDFIEEVVTENFLNNLKEKINEAYENNIKLKREELADLESDLSKFSKLKSKGLRLDYNQILTKIDTEIVKTKLDIKAIESNKTELSGYGYYIDRPRAREKILLHAKKYSSDILNNELITKIEEKFTDYLKQLDAGKVQGKYLTIYDKIQKYKKHITPCGSNINCEDTTVIACFTLFALIFALAILTSINYSYIKDFGDAYLASCGMLLGFSLIIVLSIYTYYKVAEMVSKHAAYNTIDDLVISDLNLEQKVNTPENQELYSTSELEQAEQDKGLQNNLEDINIIPSAPSVSIDSVD